jgi:LPS export ABC transporter protein LptC
MSFLKSRNLLLVMAMALALVLLVVIVVRYHPESQLLRMEKALPKGIDVSLQDIDYTHIEEGRARWRLVARQVERRAESGSLTVDNPKMDFYDSQGGSKGSLQANQGIISDDYQKVGLRGEVILKNASGYTLYTDSLDYDQSTRTATSDVSVHMLGDGVSLEGTGLVFYLQQDRFILNSDVIGFFDPAKTK